MTDRLERRTAPSTASSSNTASARGAEEFTAERTAFIAELKPASWSVTSYARSTERTRIGAGQRAGILFGRERFGLSNEEVDLADEIVTFPVNPAFASLNIAQAVLLMSYEWMKSGLGEGAAPRFSAPEIVPAEKDVLYRFFAHLEGSLDATGYFFPPEKREVFVHNLRNMLTRAGFSAPELSTLHGVIRSLDRGPKKPSGEGE